MRRHSPSASPEDFPPPRECKSSEILLGHGIYTSRDFRYAETQPVLAFRDWIESMLTRTGSRQSGSSSSTAHCEHLTRTLSELERHWPFSEEVEKPNLSSRGIRRSTFHIHSNRPRFFRRKADQGLQTTSAEFPNLRSTSRVRSRDLSLLRTEGRATTHEAIHYEFICRVS
jgi:hypothetical protein